MLFSLNMKHAILSIIMFLSLNFTIKSRIYNKKYMFLLNIYWNNLIMFEIKGRLSGALIK